MLSVPIAGMSLMRWSVKGMTVACPWLYSETQTSPADGRLQSMRRFDADKPVQITGKGDNPLEWPEVLRVQQNVGDV